MFLRLIFIWFALAQFPLALGQEKLPSNLQLEYAAEIGEFREQFDLNGKIPEFDQTIILGSEFEKQINVLELQNRDVTTLDQLLGDLYRVDFGGEARRIEDLIGSNGVVVGGSLFPPNFGGPQDRPPAGGGPIFDPPDDLKVPLAQGGLRNSVGRGACDNGLLARYAKIDVQFGVSPFDRRIYDPFQRECLPALPAIALIDDLSAKTDRRLLREMHRIHAHIVLLKNAAKNANLCTGLAVDRDIVLTAAHCLAKSNGDPFEIDADSLSDYSATNADGESVFVESIIATGSKVDAPFDAKSIRRGELSRDVVLLKLSKPVVDSRLEQSVFPAVLKAGTPLSLFGRRTGESEASANRIAVVRNEGCRLHFDAGNRPNRLFHQCITEGGMSGGPIFAQTEEGYLHLVGIHQAGAVTAKIETPSEQSLPSCIISADWCDDTLTAYRFLNVGHFVSLIGYMEDLSDA